MKQANGQKPVSRVRASVVLSIASVVFTGLTVLGIWLMWRYMDDPTKVREIIGDHYVLGALCMILISAVQVVVALIPGELVEISAGYVFGAWGGALLCLAGTTLGSVLVLLRSVRVRLLPQGEDRRSADSAQSEKTEPFDAGAVPAPRHAQGPADLRHRADGHEHPLLPCPDDGGTVPVRHYVHGRRKCRRGKEIPLGSGCFPCDSRHQFGRTVPVQPDRQAPCAGVCRGCGTSPTAARVPPVTSPRPLFPAQERPDALIGKSGQCRRSGAPDKKRHPLPFGTEGVFSVSESPGRHSADRQASFLTFRTCLPS